MKLFSCAVRDLATEAFGRPFYVNHTALAVRSFSDEVNNPESELGRHAKDYELWLLAVFDDANGVYESNPERLARASDLVKG